MYLTQFIRDRSDVELERLAREDTAWRWAKAYREEGRSYQDTHGCLLCNAFDLRSEADYYRATDAHREVEDSYIDLACQNGEAQTGAMVARLARRELGRRAMEAIGDLEDLPQVEVVA